MKAGRVSTALSPGGPDVEQLGAGQTEQQDRGLVAARRYFEEVEQGRLAPVDVVEDARGAAAGASSSSTRRIAQMFLLPGAVSATPIVSATRVDDQIGVIGALDQGAELLSAARRLSPLSPAASRDQLRSARR